MLEGFRVSLYQQLSQDTLLVGFPIGVERKPLSTKEIEAAWEDLAKEDSARAYDVIRRFGSAPGEPIAFLRRHIKPVPAADEKRLARLIADLDAEEFAVREKATQELERLAEGAARLGGGG